MAEQDDRPDGPGQSEAAGGTDEDPAGWIPNIGTRQRLVRLAFGVVMLGMAVYLSWLLLTEEVSRWWRLALVGLYLPAMLGLLQAKEKT